MKNKCQPEQILSEHPKKAAVCNFAQRPNVVKRTARLAKKGYDVTTYLCDFHQKPKNIPAAWRV